jgi:lysophospholipase L1-like esterase
MRRRAPWGLAALLTLALLAGVATPRHRAGAASPGAYIALGDSVAAGIGSSLPRTRSYPALVQGWLSAQLGGTVVYANLAVPGETTATFLSGGQFERFKQEVARDQQAGVPVLAISVTLGGNELLDVSGQGLSDRQAALDDFAQRYPDALGQIRAQAPEARLVVTTYYDPTAGDATVQYSDAWWIAQFNAVITNAAQAHGALVADANAGFQRMTDVYTRYPLDVHPTNAGHLALARLVWGALGFDRDPPQITAAPPVGEPRRTPTLRFSVTDPAGLQEVHVSVDADGASASPPVMVGGAQDHYATLLDFTAIDAGAVTVTIEAVDQAGNVGQQALSLTVPAGVAPPAASPTSEGPP